MTETDARPATPVAAYEPPRIERLGTLAELTLGTTDNSGDGLNGYNGGNGSL